MSSLGALATLPEELVRGCLFLSARTPRDLGNLRGASRGVLALARSTELSFHFTGRRVALDRFLPLAGAMRCARFRHGNVRSEELLVAAAAARAVVASKCFCLGDAVARDALTKQGLEALHIGDVLWLAPRAPTARGLRLLGLTNGTVSSALLGAVARGALPSLEVLFLGGCLVDGDGDPPPAPRTIAVVETTFLGAAAADVVARHVVGVETVDLAVASVAELGALRATCAATPEVLAAALEAVDGRKHAPLHAAALRDDAAACAALVACGADPLHRDHAGSTALVRAAEQGAGAAVAALSAPSPFLGELLGMPNHRHEHPLYVAALKGRADVVARLLAVELAAAPAAAPSAVVADRADRDRFTPLHASIVGRHAAVLRLLLGAVGRGAVLDAPNRYGQTPLHLAARAGEPDLVAPLLEAGASAAERDERGATALDVCLEHIGRTRLRGEACLALLERSGAKAGKAAKPRRRRRPRAS